MATDDDADNDYYYYDDDDDDDDDGDDDDVEDHDPERRNRLFSGTIHGWTPEEWKAWIAQLPSEGDQGWTKAQWEEWWLKRTMRCCNFHMERSKL